MSADIVARGLAARAQASVTSIANAGLYPANIDARDIARLTQVATACRMPDSIASSNKSFVARSAHIMRASGVDRIAIAIPNWLWSRDNGKLEFPTGGGIQIRASIEYPEQNLIPVTFAGQVRPFLGENAVLVSDLIPVSIPKGARFGIRVWGYYAGTGTTVFMSYPNNLFSNGPFREISSFVAGVSTDYSQQTTTSGGALWTDSASQQAFHFRPLAILGVADHASVACVGDSITGGIGDTPDASGDMGLSPRGVGGANGYINLGSSGDSLAVFRTASQQRLNALRYTRNAVCAHGVNDISAGRTLAQIQADMLWLWTLLKGTYRQKRLFQLTITPETDSTDNWATLANQTAKTYFSTAGNGTREQLNDWLRDGAPTLGGAAAATGSSAAGTVRVGSAAHPLDRVFDVADAAESSRNSGKWRVDGTAGKWTADGVHPSQFGYLSIIASAAIDVSQFVA